MSLCCNIIFTNILPNMAHSWPAFLVPYVLALYCSRWCLRHWTDCSIFFDNEREWFSLRQRKWAIWAIGRPCSRYFDSSAESIVSIYVILVALIRTIGVAYFCTSCVVRIRSIAWVRECEPFFST